MTDKGAIADIKPVARRPSISVIVPTFNSHKPLARLLDSLKEQTEQDFEVIVVDRWSRDGTSSLPRPPGLTLLLSDCDRAEARNLGARAARSDLLLFLDSDMHVSREVIYQCATEISTADALVLPEVTVDGGSYWARCRGFEKLAYQDSDTFCSARCLRKSTFLALGGYRQDVTGLEDMELQARILKSKLTVRRIRATTFHHEEGVGLIEYLRKRRHYARADNKFFHLHPQYGRELSSVKLRLALLRSFFSDKPLKQTLLYVPGILFQRLAETLVRTSTRHTI